MGLISRVSSRTYRHELRQSRIWKILKAKMASPMVAKINAMPLEPLRQFAIKQLNLMKNLKQARDEMQAKADTWEAKSKEQIIQMDKFSTQVEESDQKIDDYFNKITNLEENLEKMKTEKIAVILENQNLQQKVTEIEQNLVDSTNENAELKGKLSEIENQTSHKTSEINEK